MAVSQQKQPTMRPDVMAIPLVSKQPDADSERFARADAVLGAKKKTDPMPRCRLGVLMCGAETRREGRRDPLCAARLVENRAPTVPETACRHGSRSARAVPAAFPRRRRQRPAEGAGGG